MNKTKVGYVLSARYSSADINNTEAVDAFAEKLAKEFDNCMVSLDYDLVAVGFHSGIINVEIIVSVDNTTRVAAFPRFVQTETATFVLDEDSCEAATL